MEEKILDDEEAELFGLKRKKYPSEEPLPVEDGDNGTGQSSEEEIEEGLEVAPEEDSSFEGYAVTEQAPLDFSEAEEDDESLVMLSPEEAANLIRKREEKARKDRELCEKLKNEGKEALDKGDFEKARECFTQANEFDPGDLEINVGYMRAYSEDFTLLDEFESTVEVYEQCYESAQEPFAQRIKELFEERLQSALKQAEAEEVKKNASFTAAQDARREEFSARANKHNGSLLKLGLPLALCLLVAVISVCFITAVEGSVFVILSIVFGAVAVILLPPTVLVAKKAVDASRLLHENERLNSTEEGRELERLQRKIEFIRECLK